jgi:protease IV
MRALLALILNILRVPFWPLWRLLRVFGRPRARWVVVRLRPRLVELERPLPFLARYVPGLARMLPTPLSVLRRLRERVAADPRVDGVVFVIPPLTAGWATCKGLRDVFEGLRAEGKQVVAFLPRGGGNRELYVASAASRFLLGPEASLAALGLAIESRYLKPLLDRVGVKVEAFARGEYKTAAESLVRETMSDAQREQLEALLAAIDRDLVGAVAARMGGSEAQAREVFERAFVRSGTAVEMGLADGVCYEDELPTRLTADGTPARLVRAPTYLAFHGGRFFGRVLPRPHIAVIELHGVIVDEAGSAGQRAVGLEDTVRALRAVRADRRALGVVLHIDSPGGSATASDLIHREVVRLAEKKPVVACFGNVAASGGYYIAAPTHAIVAQPVSVTGSIGVVSARLLARDLLGRLGVRTHTLRTAPHADMFSANRELTEDERGIVERELNAFYETFVQVVARGRGRSPEEVDQVARGRVWAASDAQGRGLVDRLGGLEVAVDEVRARLPLPEAARRAVEPRRVGPPRGEPPPPEPLPAEPSPAALWGRLAPEAGTLLALASGRDRILYYAAGLPTIE